MNPNDLPQPADLLARGFASHVVQWARQHGPLDDAASAMLHHIASQLSLASSDGHVCARLADIASASKNTGWNSATLRACLTDSGVTGSPAAPGAQPLILDDDDRLYLHRYYDYEQRLARRLMQPRAALPQIDPALKTRLNNLFAPNQASLAGRPDWQKIGAGLSLLSPLTIISGGPGTGKTTTVVNLLACLLEQNPDCRVALAAPTGKAAARMLEALRLRAEHLPPAIQSRLPAESFTIHRLLGVTPSAGEFRHHAGNLLALDVLIVDEASMLDLALATKLFEAIPTTARIILLGDKDQLAAVESGAVFAELSADPTLDPDYRDALAALTDTAADLIRPAAPLIPTALHNSVIWFTENFRFSKSSGIGRLSAAINAGDADTTLALLRAGDDPAIRWIDSDTAAPGASAMQAIFAGYTGYIDAVRSCTGSPDTLFTAFNRFRVLCAIRETPRGVIALNSQISSHVRAQLNHPHDPGSQSAWYPGRPVMVLRNDHVMRLFNGDIGIAFPDQDGVMMVYFPDGAEGLRAIAPVRLPEHDTAFAMTVHKSQGSEFDEVMLMLPAEMNRVLARELVYTGVTRSRRDVVVVGGSAVIGGAVRVGVVRESGLVARLGAGLGAGLGAHV
ncbi:exodeoxyribonuclease V subunit alpha [Actimicrobium antarcticum]|uniref:RecBCD enzyme subunit RecD n=1 Tax=Actimicrobium antarcticum TaxID=1051899 RepID=A0ABP7SSA1_9BURK